ncbi:MAG: MacB family efflux pump subunit [Arcobacteraceae bacterium]|jgi:macrolide transport system ATP-binding/permease protein|nr:MacB family efflux pump subunit [Arcobacteraceae bacterium]
MSNIKPIIKLEKITKVFQNDGIDIKVLNGIDLEIYQGEFVAIVGSSGSGKSTLMNIIGCLDNPSSGIYEFMGKDISLHKKDELATLRRETFGFIFQSYNLITSLNACENVEVPAIYAGVSKDERRKKSIELLSSLGLDHRLEYRPSQLSGGQQQRVSIARALINGANIILADEPTGALDSKSGQEVIELLRNFSKQGYTIILITHDKEIASYANRVIEIRDGLVVHDEQKAIKKEIKITNKVKDKYSFKNEIIESMQSAFKALKMNIYRTILTLLGIVIGVGSVIVMLAIGDGAKKSVLDQISSMGTNVLIIRPGMPNSRGFSNIATLVKEDADAINDLNNIIAAIPENRQSLTVRYKNNDQTTSINTTGSEYVRVRNWDLERGIFFSAEDEKNYAKVAVIGTTVAKTLFGDSDPIGEYMMIKNILFQVIGVMKTKGASMFGEDEDDIVFVPFTTGSLYITGQNFLRNITVAVEDVDLIEETEKNIHSLLLSRHGGIEDFRIRNMASLIDNISETQNTMTILLGSIAAISLLVGGIGVMNIMLVSVTERTKEIGIRMATGARTRNILQQFLIEAVVVSALGGLIGVIIGLLIAFGLEYFDISISFSIFPVVLAFSCSFLTGIIFGYLPAKKASSLNPVIALSAK